MEKEKTSSENYKKQLETANSQIAEANKQIENFKGMDIDSIKQAAEEYKTKFEQSEKEKTDLIYKTKLSAYVKGLGLKDDIYETHVTNLLMEKGLKFEGDKLIGGDDVVKEFADSHPNAYAEDPILNQLSARINPPPKPNGDGVEAAFLAKNPNLKID